MNEDPAEGGFVLVVPFIVTASHGGPYDDAAYVAGYEAGQIAGWMDRRSAIGAMTVRSANAVQIDLLAMHHGYSIPSIKPWEDDPDWSTITLLRPALDAGEAEG